MARILRFNEPCGVLSRFLSADGQAGTHGMQAGA